MKLLKTTTWLAATGFAAALFASPAIGLAYTDQVYAPATTQAQTTTTVTNSRSMTVNPNDPKQFPPANFGFSADQRQGNFKAAYVDQQIAIAKSHGIDTSVAENQSVIGRADLKKGLNQEAAQHFDNALRALGVMPAQPQHNSGEVGMYHAPMPR
jgi:hypothetical protein